MTRRAPLVGGALAVVLAIGGGWIGASLAEPQTSARPAVVDATVSPALAGPISASDLPEVGTRPTREAIVGMTAAAIRADVIRYLEAVTVEPDPAEAAGRLASTLSLGGADDACATGPGCLGGVSGAVAGTVQTTVESGSSGRTLFYAPTPDLVIVTVGHNPGDTVRAYPNVLNGFETECDPVIAGYDLLVKPVGQVTVPFQGAERTSFAFDINEGITAMLCLDVIPPGVADLEYHAQAIVRTADRLVPSLSVTSISGQSLPGWIIRGYLPSGQPCGSFAVPGAGVPGSVSREFGPAHVVCDLSDVTGRAGVSVGRGLLPLSSGDRSTLTVEFAYAQTPPDRTSLSLGVAALCTGACPLPEPSYFAVRGRFGSAVVRLSWSQGNSNGSPATGIFSVTDTASASPVGAQLDVATSGIRQSGFDVAARTAFATVSIRADGNSTFVARLVPDPTDPCTRPEAVLEQSGVLEGPIEEEWTAAAAVEFSGLCAGAEYAVEVTLTDSGGTESQWTTANWGAPARIHVREMAVPVIIDYRLNNDAYQFGYSPNVAALTVRESDQYLVGPHAGGCFGTLDSLGATATLPVLRLGEHVHLSGSVQTAIAALENGCTPAWQLSSLAVTFERDFTLEQLFAADDGLMFRVDQPLDADPSIRAQASAVIHIALDR